MNFYDTLYLPVSDSEHNTTLEDMNSQQDDSQDFSSSTRGRRGKGRRRGAAAGSRLVYRSRFKIWFKVNALQKLIINLYAKPFCCRTTMFV
jgi:hypothetical protein